MAIFRRDFIDSPGSERRFLFRDRELNLLPVAAGSCCWLGGPKTGVSDPGTGRALLFATSLVLACASKKDLAARAVNAVCIFQSLSLSLFLSLLLPRRATRGGGNNLNNSFLSFRGVGIQSALGRGEIKRPSTGRKFRAGPKNSTENRARYRLYYCLLLPLVRRLRGVVFEVSKQSRLSKGDLGALCGSSKYRSGAARRGVTLFFEKKEGRKVGAALATRRPGRERRLPGPRRQPCN